ncbi:DNA primase large subunit [Psilocybe cubensis]|uniref:DNA primase large subunit n=2 Tax=Psilocybe cubensis TaxID=181762 RepID=A0A8H7Y5P3_PSICU|nr:DNA primase large subunit [Psilocybe cubensis]KAH9484214.1 DNA primase large subunit [Psilocybe cubensis]
MFKGGQSTSNDYGSFQVENFGTLKYPFTLNFYDEPPTFDVTIEDFETSALDRLRILAEIESSAARNRSWEETKQVTSAQCSKYLPLSPTMTKSLERDAQRRRDHLSHFVLRLAFCRSEDLRRRFVKAETTLFKIRYDEDIATEREAFLNSRDFNWIPVDPNEALSVDKDYRKSEKYYKVKWTRVPDLVEKRKVVLKGGWAYVPSRELSSIVFQEFEVRLEKALETTARLLPRLDEDTRIVPILDNLSQGFLSGISSDWANNSGQTNSDELKAEQIDDLAKKHFPLCMRTLHSTLQRDHHLKYAGRQQYGLFLKVLGLSIEESVAFWRKSFSGFTDDQFNKKYKYNIRHHYGLEGKRVNYPARSCMQLLMDSGASDHGCPYRTYSPENLQTALLSAYSPLGLRQSDLGEVMAAVNTKHFHVACTRVYEITHASNGVSKGQGLGNGESVTHPNEYAAKSMELLKSSEAMVVDS